MFAPDPEVIRVVSEWVKKAENDLVAVVQLMKLGRQSPMDVVCFHAQQCVEKYLKALLANHERDFPKTHNIATLMALLPPGAQPTLTPLEQTELTRYATVTRYPGDYEPITLTQARAVVRLVRRVRRAARQRLPKEALKLVSD